MKKFLLGTTALVGLAAASAAQAGGAHYAAETTAAPANTGGLSVMVGGFVDVQHAFIDQEENASNVTLSSGNANTTGTTLGQASDGGAGETRNTQFTNDAEIHVTVAGSAEDFDYGAVIELNAGLDADPEADGLNADKAYLFIESDDFGRAEFGSNSGASETLEIDASNIARATGGVGGDWWHYVDWTGVSATAGTAATGANFILEPNLPVTNDFAVGADAAKITYYTPRLAGFQLGVSYTPDTGDLGSAAWTSGRNNGGINASQEYGDVFAGGVNYEADFDGVGLAVAAVAEHGRAEDTTPGTAAVEDLEAYSVGAKVDVAGFSIAGNWADNGESGQALNSGLESSYWTLGAAFENGPYGISATYMESTVETGATTEDELENIVIGADYAMAPGFTPYIEAAFFDLDQGNNATTVDNDGSVVILGAELSF
jgi:hypothetical protein